MAYYPDDEPKRPQDVDHGGPQAKPLTDEQKRQAAAHDEQRDISLTGGDDKMGAPQRDRQHREHEPRSSDASATNNPWTQAPRESDA